MRFERAGIRNASASLVFLFIAYISARLVCCGERGLLSVAFPPGFAAIAGALLPAGGPAAAGGAAQAPGGCVPTAGDAEGPFYKPGAPERANTGSGLSVRGKVLGAPDCRPLPGARVEWWQANTAGEYDDAHRGSRIASAGGEYAFTTDMPGIYPFRPRHIHFKVSAPGFAPLTTQLYLRGGEAGVTFDLVLSPSKPPSR